MRKSINLTSLSKKYGPGYVARIEGTTKVIDHAKQPDVLLKKIKHKKEFKENKVIISWIPKYGARYLYFRKKAAGNFKKFLLKHKLV